MTPSHLFIVAVALVAIWSTFEGAERDLFALLDEPAPAWIPVRVGWITARAISALVLTASTVWWILGGGA